MARTAAPKSEIKPTITTNGVIAPQSPDPVRELFYMLGVMRGANVDGAIRVAELANLLIPTTNNTNPGGE